MESSKVRQRAGGGDAEGLIGLEWRVAGGLLLVVIR